MKLIKKGIALSLVALLSMQNLHASFSDDILGNSLTNITPSGMIVDRDASGHVKSTNFYTSSVYFKFGGAYNYPEPLFSMSPPQMSIGCGGLSIKGMFGSIIGLDRLEQMLKNAGASLAWGIAVGLVYSLPGIGSAFKMIDEWSKKIQQLMANACQSGQKIGQMIGEDKALKDRFTDNAFTRRADLISKELDQYSFTKVKEAGLGDYFDDNMVLKVDTDNKPSPQQVSAAWSEFLMGSLVTYSMRTNVLSTAISSATPTIANNFYAKVFGVTNTSNIKKFDVSQFSITYNNTAAIGRTFTMSDIVSLFASSTSFESQHALAQSFMSIALASHISGDLITPEPEILDLIMKTLNDMSTTGTAISESEKKSLGDIIAGNKEIPRNSNAQIQPGNIKKLAKDIVNYFYFGNISGITPANMSAVDQLNEVAPTVSGEIFGVNALGYMATAFPDPDNVGNRVIIFVPIATTVQWFDSNINNAGALGKSKTLISDIINNGANSTFMSNANTAQGGIKLLVPGIIQKIKIIQQSPMDQRHALIDLLAKYNAYQAVKGMVTGFFTNGNAQKTGMPIFISPAPAGTYPAKFTGKIDLRKGMEEEFGKTIQAAQTHMSTLEEEIDYALKEKAYGLSVSVPDAVALEEVFDKQNKRNIANATKSTQTK